MNKLSNKRSANSRKLTLNRETIVQLSELHLRHVVGGEDGSGPICRTGSFWSDCTSKSQVEC
jgi:hypothetical protein